MKETQNHNTDNIENVKQVQQIQNEQQIIGSMMLKKGQKVFEVNMVTGDVKIAEFERMPISFKDKKENKFAPNKLKLVINKDCKYMPALNVQNAMRKMGFAVKIVKK